jgi:hypothetical protein
MSPVNDLLKSAEGFVGADDDETFDEGGASVFRFCP